MIFVNKSKFHNVNSLYDIPVEKMQVIDASEHPLTIKRVMSKDEIFFLLDPAIEEIKLLTDLGKEMILMFTYMHEDYLDLLRNDQVKQTIVIDDLDALMLNKRDMKKFVRAAPFDINSEEITGKDYTEMTHSCICYDDIDTITEEDTGVLTSVPHYGFKTIYSGFKVIKKKSDFKRLMEINRSNVQFKSFPIFDPGREINVILYTIGFPKKVFPIVAAVTAANKNLPMLFTQRYYNWILTDLQSPRKEFLDKMLDKSFRDDLRKEQFELFTNHFSSLPNIREVISEYEKTD